MKKTFSLTDIENIAQEIIDIAKAQNTNVIALSGELGAGKTTLSQVIAKKFGVEESVVSPTFVIMKFYELHNQPWDKLVHIDAYRLKSKEELLHLGWEALMKDPKNIILIEWPEQVPGALPASTLSVTLMHTEENTREIEIM